MQIVLLDISFEVLDQSVSRVNRGRNNTVLWCKRHNAIMNQV
jgi:hypothetical protein